MSLPVEVRTLFYDAYFMSVHLHLFSTRGRAAKAFGTPLQCRSNVRGGNTLALLAVSKTVREEALSSLGNMDIEISVMVSNWRQFNRKDVVGIHPIHAIQIHTIRLAFLDSNYSLLQGLPSLKQVLIAPSGEFTCRRPSTGDGSRLWKESEIGGSFALEAMQAQLFDDIQLMQGLLETSPNDMALDISYDVGFKFQIEDITWSHGRPNPKRNNFESVVSRMVSFHPSANKLSGAKLLSDIQAIFQ